MVGPRQRQLGHATSVRVWGLHVLAKSNHMNGYRAGRESRLMVECAAGIPLRDQRALILPGPHPGKRLIPQLWIERRVAECASRKERGKIVTGTHHPGELMARL